MNVVCINDAKLPPGANVIKDQEYEVARKYINSYDQVVYIIEGVTNQGKTKFGLPWEGYSAVRFATAETLKKEINEEEFALI